MALAAERKLKEALAIQRRALDLSQGKPEFRIGLARLALQAGDKATAREELAKLEQLGTSFKYHAEVKALMQKL
jgi:thioredoxin-like negative regulator of GroEL